MLDWLTEDSWTQGAVARNRKGEEVACTSTDAESFDLFGAIFISKNWNSVDDFYGKIAEVKKIFQLIQPVKYKELSAVGEVRISQMNDSLDNFGQVKQLLTMLEL